ncbi:hypothetical protein E2562_013439 [Oryza meyeriana var. granulata]|uniref:Uncharacterized protein n=1 Tax=Oryza meyeriana var. granulata TaxID=110450 RepID=A0A6G1EBA3_9ORYZ|nr:hypothetical protein E2562_013439 [Oryza meyeriana var. granulata]
MATGESGRSRLGSISGDLGGLMSGGDRWERRPRERWLAVAMATSGSSAAVAGGADLPPPASRAEATGRSGRWRARDHWRWSRDGRIRRLLPREDGRDADPTTTTSGKSGSGVPYLSLLAVQRRPRLRPTGY